MNKWIYIVQCTMYIRDILTDSDSPLRSIYGLPYDYTSKGTDDCGI